MPRPDSSSLFCRVRDDGPPDLHFPTGRGTFSQGRGRGYRKQTRTSSLPPSHELKVQGELGVPSVRISLKCP